MIKSKVGKLESIHKQGLGKEHPRSHQIQLLAAIIFFLIWVLDSFVFMFTIGLANYVPLFIRIILFLSLIVIGLYLIFRTGHILFHQENMPSKLMKSGIFAHLRHPLYFGVLLIYLGCIFLTISLFSIIGFIVVFILYNFIATFEENELEKLFKEEYLDYKKRVRKWVPSFKR